MDNNEYLASIYRSDVPQMAHWRGVLWAHEVNGDWFPQCVYEGD